MNHDRDEAPSQYKEKKWGKTEDGQYIIDGYAFRGRQSFTKVVEGMKKFFKKGIEHDMDGIKTKALDAREKRNGLEIDIEMTDKDGRGVAVLKLYGPSKRKENVVMVNKSKQSDSKYVLKLAENIIKPWMKKILKNEEETSPMKKSVSRKGKRVILLKCPYCDVTSYSSPGLKGHITKKHTQLPKMKKDVKNHKASQKRKFDSNDTLQKNEVLDVVDYLLSEVIEISDDDDSQNHSKVDSLEEMSGNRVDNLDK